MTRLHPYIAAFLLALAWLLRERWDSVTFAAADMPPWWAWVLLAGVVVPWVPTIRGGLASVWQRVRTNMPSESPGLIRGFFAGVVAASLVIGFAAWITASPWPNPPTPKPEVVVPVETGPLSIFLIHEAKEKTPALARTITDLRAGPAADYLAKQKHTLMILDDDSKDANGEPSAVLKQWREKFATVKLPALLIVGKSGAVLHADTLKDGATADNIVELIRTKEGKQ